MQPILDRRLVAIALLAGVTLRPRPMQGQELQQESFRDEMLQVAAAEEGAMRANNGQQTLAASEADAAQALVLLGGLKVAEQLLPQACDSYERALELVDHDPGGSLDKVLPQCVSLSKARGEAKRDWMLEARQYRRTNQSAEAAQALAHAWRQNDNESIGLTAVAAFASAGKRKEAEALGEQIVRSGNAPVDANAYVAVASAFHNGGDVNGAIVELQNAVKLAPESSSAHLALGTAIWELNGHQYNPDALREFTEAQRLEPGSYAANFSLGILLSQYHRYQQADRFLNTAATLDPATPDPWLHLGIDAFTQGQTQAASEALRRAIQLTGNDEAHNNYAIRQAYEALSRIATETGQIAEGDRLAQHADELHTNVAQAMTPAAASASVAPNQAVSADVSTSRQTSADATKNETPEPAAPPSSEWAALERDLQGLVAGCLNDAGTALAQQRDYADALPFFREAADADADYIPVERNLGLAAFHIHHFEEAKKALDKALEQMPGDPITLKYLQELNEQQ